MNTTPRTFVDVPADSHFPVQNLPYGVFRPIMGGPPRVGVAIGEWVLDLAVLAEAGLLDGRHLSGAGVFRRASLNAFMALGRPAWREARELVSRLLAADEPPPARRRGRCATRRCVPAGLGRDAAAGRGRRLHRLLLLARARHQRRRHVPRSRCRAAAQLAAPAGRLPRPGQLARRQRHGRAPAVRPDPPRRRRAAAVRPVAAAGLRAGDRRAHRARQRRWASRSRSSAPRSTSSASCWSTTGAPATSRSGSTCRSARSWARTSPPRSRRGSSPSTPSSRSAAPAPVQDPAPLPYLRSTGRQGLSTSTSRCWLQSASGWPTPARIAAGQLPGTSTGASRSRSPTTPSTAATCGPATCWPRARSAGRRRESRGSLLELAWRGTEPLELPDGETPDVPRGRRPRDDDRLVPGRRLPRRLRRAVGPSASRPPAGVLSGIAPAGIASTASRGGAQRRHTVILRRREAPTKDPVAPEAAPDPQAGAPGATGSFARPR